MGPCIPCSQKHITSNSGGFHRVHVSHHINMMTEWAGLWILTAHHRSIKLETYLQNVFVPPRFTSAATMHVDNCNGRVVVVCSGGIDHNVTKIPPPNKVSYIVCYFAVVHNVVIFLNLVITTHPAGKNNIVDSTESPSWFIRSITPHMSYNGLVVVANQPMPSFFLNPSIIYYLHWKYCQKKECSEHMTLSTTFFHCTGPLYQEGNRRQYLQIHQLKSCTSASEFVLVEHPRVYWIMMCGPRDLVLFTGDGFWRGWPKGWNYCSNHLQATRFSIILQWHNVLSPTRPCMLHLTHRLHTFPLQNILAASHLDAMSFYAVIPMMTSLWVWRIFYWMARTFILLKMRWLCILFPNIGHCCFHVTLRFSFVQLQIITLHLHQMLVC